MRLALLFNERPSHVPPHVPDDLFEEYDGMDTVHHIAQALGELGVTVELVPAGHELDRQLRDGRYAMAFNIAEGPVNLVGRARRYREALPVAACEAAGVPCTGSNALTLALTLDKALTRRAVSPAVPVAPALLFQAAGHRELGSAMQQAGEALAGGALSFPVMVKPNDEGSSKGIRAHNVAPNAARAIERVSALWADYGCPVLVEEFLPGTEVTVAIAGNGSHARVLGMMEIAPRSLAEPFVYSLEVKRDYCAQVTYHVPPRLAPDTLQLLGTHALTAFHMLGCRDIARMDFRLDGNGRPCFLECNALPGLHPEHSDIVILSRGMLTYEQLVQGILLEAARRNGISMPARRGVA